MSDTNRKPGALCNACGGDGRIADPKAAIIGREPQTVIIARLCRWCRGTGRRPNLHPPV
ncbi:hypothetical protein [Saccharomonospora viridis]|uniref:hypothetical protein n=1 Tax=Saccharomonospora viridis TaxID=1852 RepID=UPI0001A382C7|nr:hypothetical protein [Saccharomonospora viridis]